MALTFGIGSIISFWGEILPFPLYYFLIHYVEYSVSLIFLSKLVVMAMAHRKPTKITVLLVVILLSKEILYCMQVHQVLSVKVP